MPTQAVTRAVPRGRVLSVAAASALVLALTAAVLADPYPPYWSNGTGTAIHYAPVAWPAENTWIAYTRAGAAISDARDNDASNGGTSPQNYVNVTSGCTDLSSPSIYYQYSTASGGTLFFRWRVEQAAHTYATGPNPGNYNNSGPWSSALWTVFVDTNGDGFRDFAVHLDGSSGAPSTAIDRLASIYSTTISQSIDYVNDSSIKLLKHNPTAFVDGPSGTDRLLNFQSIVTPASNWPNGSSETSWDYGTTRAINLNTGCGEYFIDYQIPLSMLDATSHGGPQITATTPIALFFATANSLNNPLQKDAVVSGSFIADPASAMPTGDTITPAGGTIPQPIVNTIGASSCGPTTLTATVADTLTADRTTSVASVDFNYYLDTNANGSADDGSSWTLAASGTASTTQVGLWTATWGNTAVTQGQYLIGVKATDQQGNITWSYRTQAELTAAGLGVPNYPNPPDPGVKTATVSNTCGAAGASLTTTANATQVSGGGSITFTLTVNNPTSSAISVSALRDTLPAGFTYQSTSGSGTIGAATTAPAASATGTLEWTFSPAATIPAGTTRTLIFTATAASAAGTYTNNAAATSSAGTLTSDPLAITVVAPALTIAKTASVSNVSPGDTIVFTITYANDSAVNVTNAVITDVLPTGLEFVSAAGGAYAAGSRTVTWNISGLPSNSGSHTVSVATTVTNPYPDAAAIPLVNTASIASSQTTDASGSVSVAINAPRPTLTIQNEGNVTQVAAGGQVTHTISYANTGAAAATNVTITDTVQSGFSFVSATGGGTHNSGTVTWNIGTVAAATTGSVQLTLQSANPFTATNPSTNTASISSTQTSAVSDSFAVSVTQDGQICNSYFFRNSTTNVGADGSRRIANATAVTASDTGASVSATSTGSANVVEAVRFYQDPALTSSTSFVGTLTSGIYIDRDNGNGSDVTGAVYDYNPTTGVKTLLGSQTTAFTGSTKGLFSFSVPVNVTIQANNRLLWIFSMASRGASTTTTVHFMYGGTVTNPISGGTTAALSNASFCTPAPANQPPVVATTASGLTYTEGNGVVALDGLVTVTDVDSPQLVSATVTLMNYVAGEDVLAFGPQSGISGSFNAATGVLTLSGSATVANYQAALRSVTYANTSATPSPVQRVAQFIVNDGTANSNTATRAINVVDVSAPQPDPTPEPEPDTAPEPSDRRPPGQSPEPTPQTPSGSATTPTNTPTNTAANTPPTISAIGAHSIASYAPPQEIPFVVGDAETAADRLTVSWTSSDARLIQTDCSSIAGEGAERVLTLCPYPGRWGTATITLVVSDGELTARTTFTLSIVPARLYYLSEGATGGIFESRIVVTNPNGNAAPISVVVMKPDGTVATRQLEIPAMTRRSIPAADLTGGVDTAYSAVVESLADLPLLVERSMSWDSRAYGAHAEAAVHAPSRRWYFAEGSDGFFTAYLLLGNPGHIPATVTVNFFLQPSGVATRTFQMHGTSRLTVPLSSIPELAGRSFAMDVSSTEPVTAERSMYFNTELSADGGHVSAGVAAPSRTWLFSEGATWYITDAFFLIANPNSVPTKLTITYRTNLSQTIVREHQIGPHARLTIDVRHEDSLLQDAHFWTTIAADQPVVAERSMYWHRPLASWVDGHNSAGVTMAASKWGFADGAVGGPTGLHTFLLLANAAPVPTNVRITFFRNDGSTVVKNYVLQPYIRFTVWMNGSVPELENEEFWIQVESTDGIPILVERSMYWDALGQFWAAGTSLFGTPLP